MNTLTYKQAGVDIDEGERLISLISPLAKQTFRPEVLINLGSFGALFELDLKKYKTPVLVSGTDGVGTKLKVAFMADKHDTVGIDLVAMCVNDILTLGAEPLFFLDYFATGKLSADKAKDVIKGIAEGCIQAGCSLIGGETAEMPGFYEPNEYDLAGFAVGVVDKAYIVDGSKVTEGDVLIGLPSSGIHSNGFSLVRKVFFEKHSYRLDTYIPELSCALAEELLKPTHIYVKAIMQVMSQVPIKAMAHITGSGLYGNVTRAFDCTKYNAVIDRGAWEVLPIFKLIQSLGNVPPEDMYRTFNMGIGYVIIVSSCDVDTCLKILDTFNFKSYVIGNITKR